MNMKGDFSRGFNPDGKRGRLDAGGDASSWRPRTYRRVLLQQGRLLLDSDQAAQVESTDHLLRLLTRDLGCPSGSPNLGFLITPGRLLQHFEHTDGVSPLGADAGVCRDYSLKYLDRYPSLRIDASAGAVTVQLTPRGPLPAGEIILWMAAPEDGAGAGTISAGGAAAPFALTGTPEGTWVRVVATAVATATTVTVAVRAGGIVHIGLIETFEAYAAPDRLWAASGWYAVDGLIAELAWDTPFPATSFDPGDTGEATMAADQPPGSRVVAYLEIGERLVTDEHDPGIREVALGGQLDTTVRTEAVGQVKWARLPGSLNTNPLPGDVVTRLQDIFAQVDLGNATLEVPASSGGAELDPCALPTIEGYTGLDNRLYRFEVQERGALGPARIKWSRDNGSGLWTVGVLSTTGTVLLTTPAGSGLQDGDLVELLNEVIERGDNGLATLGTTFTPPRRLAGSLVLLRAGDSTADGDEVWTLLDRTTGDTLEHADLDTSRYGAAGTDLRRVRRWHGLIETVSAITDYDVEDGLVVRLGGTFEVGDWWQHEARVRTENNNQAVLTTRHGPERLFAPLALLEVPAATSDPLTLHHWLDRRYSSLCELDADDVPYDNCMSGLEADTVQEAIDELAAREEGCCCEVNLEPPTAGSPASALLQEAIEAIVPDGGGVICLARGIYDLDTTVNIPSDARVVLRGCPEAVLRWTGSAGAFALNIGPNSTLELESLSIIGATHLVNVENGETRLSARGVGLFAGEGQTAITLGGPAGQTARVEMDLMDLVMPDLSAGMPAYEGPAIQVSLEDCVIAGWWGLSGISAHSLLLRRCAFYTEESAIVVGDLALLEARSCMFATGMGSALARATPEGLLYRSEQVAGLLAADVRPAGTGAPLVFKAVHTGDVEACVFTGSYGFSCYAGQDLQLRSCRFETWYRAVHLVEALRVRVDSNAVRSRVEGFRLRRQGRDVGMTGNSLEVYTTSGETGGDPDITPTSGRGLATSAPTATGAVVVGLSANPDQQLLALVIGTNHVRTGGSGIMLGSPSVGGGVMEGLRILGNSLELTDPESSAGIGIGVSGGTVASSGEPLRTDVGGLIADNVASSFSFGMFLAYGSYTVRSNVVRRPGWMGIGCLSCGDLIVTENTVTDSASLGIDITTANRVLVADNSVTALGEDYSVLYFSAVEDLVLCDNVVGSTSQGSTDVVRAATSSEAARLSFTGNTIGAGHTHVEGYSSVVLAQNRFEGTVNLIGAEASNTGEVRGNHFGADGANTTGHDAFVAEWCRGPWQVNNNRASGSMRVLPALEPMPSGAGSASAVPRFRDGIERALREIFRPDPRGAALEALVSSPATLAADRLIDGGVSRIQPQLEASLAAAVRPRTLSGYAYNYGTYSGYREAVWRVQVEANLVGATLQVGFLPDGGMLPAGPYSYPFAARTGAAGTVSQIVGDQAETISANSYQNNSAWGLNVARTFVNFPSPDTTNLLNLNRDLP